jgi:hypothetical protein
MEKSHTLFENFETAKNKMIPCSTNLIFYNDAFSKTKFMSKIMKSFEDSITYLDFDLLFSGYLESNHIAKPPNVEIIKPDKGNFKELIPNILTKASSQKTILIVDSLNGLYSFLDDENPARFVNSLIMLMATNVKFSKSILFVTCLGQKKDDVWFLPTGRHILEFENINRFEINEDAGKIEVMAI